MRPHTALANRQHNSTAPWLGLNTYAGKNLWSLLAQARKSASPWSTPAASEPVRFVEDPAAVGLNLTRSGSSGGSESGGPAVEPAAVESGKTSTTAG